MTKNDYMKLPVDTLQIVPLTYLSPSKTNPRKHFEPAKLADLAASIKEKGVLEPIIIRLTEGTANIYEIVAGERRFRASTAAGLEAIPCIVKAYTDMQVLEIQVVENMQRDDLTPMEEAEGYKMLQSKGYDFDELAAKIGKSKSYIYQRLQLLNLSPKVKQALAHGHLPVSWAELFTRVKDHKDQDSVLADCPRPGVGYADIQDLADLKKHIETNFLLRLVDAPFDTKDAKLCPEAGACHACPKRTGAQADLYGESGKTDTCQDQACWAKKVKTNKEQLLEKAKKGGLEVISGSAGTRAIEDLNRGYGQPAYVKPSRQCDAIKGAGKKTWAAAAGGKATMVTLLDESTGKTEKVYRRSEVLKLIPKTQLKDHLKSETPEAKAKAREARAKEQAKQDLEKFQVQLAAKAAVEKFSKLSEKQAIELIAKPLFDHFANSSYGGSEADLEEVFKVDSDDLNNDVRKGKIKTGAALRTALIQAMFLLDDVDDGELCKLCGIDLKKYTEEAKKLQAQKATDDLVKSRKGSKMAAGQTMDEIENGDVPEED